MTWDELVKALGVTPDDKGWLHLTRQHGGSAREHVIQHVTIEDWHLALVQTSIARDSQLGVAEAVVRLVPYPLGAIVLNDGYWVLRQALSLEGLTLDRLELTLRCLDIQARDMLPRSSQPVAATKHFKHYTE
jgi:hypothetical protein